MPKVGKKVYASVKKAKAAAKKTGKTLTYTKPVTAYKKLGWRQKTRGRYSLMDLKRRSWVSRRALGKSREPVMTVKNV